MAAERKDDVVVVDSVVALSAEEPRTTLKQDAKDTQVDSVTVYVDRAEVTRRIDFTASATGPTDVVVEGLSDYINTDSVRVKGTGAGVTILEVAYSANTKAIEPEGDGKSAREDEAVALRQQLQVWSDRKKEIAQSRAVVARTRALVDDYAGKMIDPRAHHNAGGGSDSAVLPSLDFVESLLDLQARKAAEADSKCNELDLEERDIDVKVSAAEAKLASLGAGRVRRTKTSHDVTVALNIAEAGPVTLLLSYQVSRASWSPSYDIRISSSDANLELSYFGLIQQATGEDWNGAKVVLSTAKPAVGGSAPVLPTKTVSFAPVYVDYSTRLHSRARRSSARSAGPMRESLQAAPMLNMQAAMFDASALDEDDDGPTMPSASVATSRVEAGSASATFTIERRCDVASDNKPHKVTIAIINLRSKFRHYAAPQLSPVAYLQALTKNTSEYPLLPSEKVNVFLDGSFVAVTRLDNVSPGESFRSFLGVDAAVRVTYRPVEKHRTSRGMWTKTESTTYTHRCIVKNTKAIPAHIVIADILPKSTDERIKVRMLTPTQEELDAGAAAHDSKDAVDDIAEGAGGAGRGDDGEDKVAQVKATNNVVWSRHVAAGATTEVLFEFAIDHPQGEAVTIN